MYVCLAPNISTPRDFPRRQIDFNEEVRKESEDVLEAERIAKEADKKPLWEQLAGKRDEKQAKFDAVRASMFGTLFLPPRPLVCSSNVSLLANSRLYLLCRWSSSTASTWCRVLPTNTHNYFFRPQRAVFLHASPSWQRPLEPLTTRSPTSCRG